jgi:uncharacterized protein (TIGR03435 family)
MTFVDRIGMTLLHFVWEGTLICAIYACVTKMVARACRPNVRYVLACAALAAMMCVPFVTFLLLYSPVSVDSEPTSGLAPLASRDALTLPGFPFVLLAPIQEHHGNVLPWVVTIWFAGVFVLSVRLASAWLLAERTLAAHIRLGPPDWQETLVKLGRRIGVTRRVRLMVSGRVDAPTVIRWLKPVVLVPIGALTGMPANQVEALLAHELAHIRRHDYLVNVVQGVAEAFLFYHPAIWWISWNIRKERELCCDDIAVGISGDVLSYARALAALEFSRQGLTGQSISANGGQLESRIGRLLGESASNSKKNLGSAAFITTALLSVTACVLFAQTQGQVHFQTVSIRRNFSRPSDTVALRDVRNPGFVNVVLGGRLTAGWIVVRSLIQQAYGLEPFQVGEGPDWIDTEHYDLEAKAPGDANREQMLFALQSLLQDKFKLKTHFETIDLPLYILTAATGGLKLQPPNTSDCYRLGTFPPTMPPPGQPSLQPATCGRAQISLISGTAARLTAGAVSMAELTADLSKILGIPVLDRTNVSEKFNLDIAFSPDNALAGLRGSGTPPQAVDSGSRSIFAAMENQAGLKLELTRGPMKFLIIDSVEKPPTN